MPKKGAWGASQGSHLILRRRALLLFRIFQPCNVMLKRLLLLITENELWLVLGLSPLLLFPNRYTLLGLILLPIPWICRLLAKGTLTVRTPMDIPIVGFLVMTVVSLYPSVSLYLSWPKLLGILLGASLFYALVNKVKSEKAIWVGAAALCAGGLGVALAGLVGTDWSDGKLFYLPQADKYIPRLMDIMPKSVLPTAREGFNPNEVGGALAMLLPLPLALLLFEPGVRHRVLTGPLVLVMGATLLLTQSRSAFMGIGVALLVLMLWKFRDVLLLLPVAILVFLLLTFMGGAQNLSNMILSMEDPTRSAVSLLPEDRLQLWWTASQMIQDFPLTGIGLNTFPLVMENVYPVFSGFYRMPHAHNLYLQTALDLGIPGLLAFLGLLGGFAIALARGLRSSLAGRTANISMGLACGVLAYLVYGLTDTITLGAKPGIFLWGMLGLAASLATLPSVVDRAPAPGHGLVPMGQDA